MSGIIPPGKKGTRRTHAQAEVINTQPDVGAIHHLWVAACLLLWVFYWPGVSLLPCLSPFLYIILPIWVFYLFLSLWIYLSIYLSIFLYSPAFSVYFYLSPLENKLRRNNIVHVPYLYFIPYFSLGTFLLRRIVSMSLGFMYHTSHSEWMIFFSLLFR